VLANAVDTERVLAGRGLVTMGADVAAVRHVTRVHVPEHVCRALGCVRARAAIPHVVHMAPIGQLSHAR